MQDPLTLAAERYAAMLRAKAEEGAALCPAAPYELLAEALAPAAGIESKIVPPG